MERRFDGTKSKYWMESIMTMTTNKKTTRHTGSELLQHTFGLFFYHRLVFVFAFVFKLNSTLNHPPTATAALVGSLHPALGCCLYSFNNLCMLNRSIFYFVQVNEFTSFFGYLNGAPNKYEQICNYARVKVYILTNYTTKLLDLLKEMEGLLLLHVACLID